MGFGFPTDERAALVAAQPEKFFMPIASDLRYNRVRVWLDAIDMAEMRELVVDAWHMVVPSALPPTIYVIIRERLRGCGLPLGACEDDEVRTFRIVLPRASPTHPARGAAGFRQSGPRKCAIALLTGRKNMPGAGPVALDAEEGRRLDALW